MKCVDCEYFEVRDKTADYFEPYCKKYEKAHNRNPISMMKYLRCMKDERYRPVRCFDCEYMDEYGVCSKWGSKTEKSYWCCLGVDKFTGIGWT